MVAKRGWVVLVLIATACVQAGCLHTMPYGQLDQLDQADQAENWQAESVWKKNRVTFRKAAFAFFHVPLYQLPHGFSSSYRRHLVANEHSPVVLGQRKNSGGERLASWSKPQPKKSAASESESPDSAKSADSGPL